MQPRTAKIVATIGAAVILVALAGVIAAQADELPKGAPYTDGPSASPCPHDPRLDDDEEACNIDPTPYRPVDEVDPRGYLFDACRPAGDRRAVIGAVTAETETVLFALERDGTIVAQVELTDAGDWIVDELEVGATATYRLLANGDEIDAVELTAEPCEEVEVGDGPIETGDLEPLEILSGSQDASSDAEELPVTGVPTTLLALLGALLAAAGGILVRTAPARVRG